MLSAVMHYDCLVSMTTAELMSVLFLYLTAKFMDAIGPYLFM